MKRKHLKLGVLLSAFMVLSATYVHATTGPINYTDYTIPSGHGNYYSGLHQKETNLNYITNKVIDLHSSCDKITFWALNSDNTSISNDYYFTESTPETDVKHTQTKNVKFALESTAYLWGHGLVDGYCDFH